MTTTEQVPNPTGKGGFGDNPQNINAGGRPKNSLKSYVAKKLAEMPDEKKEEFLKKIAPDLQWRMGEGNPATQLGGDEDNPLKVVILPEAVSKAFKINAINPETNRGDNEQGEV